MDHWFNGEKSLYENSAQFTYDNSNNKDIKFGGGFKGYIRNL
jgi:hypothetical protein